MKHSRPDIANVTHELSKVIDSANQVAFLEMHQVLKYVLGINTLGLKLEPNGSKEETWDIVCFSDSDHPEDPLIRKNISGFVLYVLGVHVSWQSRSQKSKSLLISKAKCVVLMEDVKEVMFLFQLL